jgi:hypothetical protein
MAQAAIDRLIPADEKVRLQGEVFADFENQTYASGNDLLTAMMEERAKLEPNARVEQAGRCPFCGSQRTYLEAQITRIERLSPSGPVLLDEQHARCRACDGSFSPSSPRLGFAQRSGGDTESRAPNRPRNHCAEVRPCRRRPAR